MKSVEEKHIKKEIPIRTYDEELECFSCEEGGYCNIYRIVPRDLVNSDVDEIEMDCFRWAKFYKTYALDVQIISMTFPCDTGTQQKYWEDRLKNNTNPVFQEMIQMKINELVWREKHTSSKEFFLVFFFDEKDQIAESIRIIENTLGLSGIGLLRSIDRKKKEKIWFKLGNKNSLIF